VSSCWLVAVNVERRYVMLAAEGVLLESLGAVQTRGRVSWHGEVEVGGGGAPLGGGVDLAPLPGPLPEGEGGIRAFAEPQTRRPRYARVSWLWLCCASPRRPVVAIGAELRRPSWQKSLRDCCHGTLLRRPFYDARQSGVSWRGDVEVGGGGAPLGGGVVLAPLPGGEGDTRAFALLRLGVQ